jgi:hypothetical protein
MWQDTPRSGAQTGGVFVSADGKSGVRIALITVAGSVLVAIVSGIFAMVASRDGDPDPPTTTTVAMAGTGSTVSTDPSTVDSTAAGTAVAEGEPPASAQVESVSVEAHDYKRVGSGLYQLGGSDKLDFRYWWTTNTDYGEIESTDTSCTVVMTISNLGSGKVVDTQRSATCSLQGWHSARLPQGRYRLAVEVAIESGSKGSGSFPFTVVP